MKRDRHVPGTPRIPQRAPKHPARGAANPSWNELGRRVASNGYEQVRVGAGHPLALAHGWAYVHLVVWVAAGHPRPGPDELLHHRNGDRLDNRLENLELMTRSEHSTHHNVQRRARRLRAVA